MSNCSSNDSKDDHLGAIRRHDFGPSLRIRQCDACNKVVLNRGCAQCCVCLCGPCFLHHRCSSHQLSTQLTESMHVESSTSPGSTDATKATKSESPDTSQPAPLQQPIHVNVVMLSGEVILENVALHPNDKIDQLRHHVQKVASHNIQALLALGPDESQVELDLGATTTEQGLVDGDVVTVIMESKEKTRSLADILVQAATDLMISCPTDASVQKDARLLLEALSLIGAPKKL